MATTIQLELKFGTLSGVKTWTFNNAESSVVVDDVKTLMDTMITNGSIYKYPPMTKESARLITKIEEPLNIS